MVFLARVKGVNFILLLLAGLQVGMWVDEVKGGEILILPRLLFVKLGLAILLDRVTACIAVFVALNDELLLAAIRVAARDCGRTVLI